MTRLPETHLAPRSSTVIRLAGDLGFVMLGIAPAHATEHTEFLQKWLDAGKQGEMAYLADHLQQRLDPAKLVPDAKAIICVADQYPPKPAQDDISAESDTQAAGKIARYAWRKDYHKDLKKRLHKLADALRAIWPEHTFRTTVDTAPVLEREHAQRAGIGWVGKHTLLIHPQQGSWFLLGEIITTLPLQTSVEAGAGVMTNHCGACTRCIDACPTQCITPFSVNASQCISYLTIEHRNSIDPALHEGMGQWVAGCDVCQEVCPFNKLGGEHEVEPQAHERLHTSLPLLEIMNWTPQAREAALQRSALKRIKLEQFKRNALIAAGNVIHKTPAHPQAESILAQIKKLAADQQEHELVRQTAAQVLSRLGKE